MKENMQTERQNSILKAIIAYTEANKIAPSIRDICEICDISSTSTVHKTVNQLLEEGKVEKRKNHYFAVGTGENPYVIETPYNPEIKKELFSVLGQIDKMLFEKEYDEENLMEIKRNIMEVIKMLEGI